jgi:hypothetical protein
MNVAIFPELDIQRIPVNWGTLVLKYFEPIKRLPQIYEFAHKGLKSFCSPGFAPNKRPPKLTGDPINRNPLYSRSWRPRLVKMLFQILPPGGHNVDHSELRTLRPSTVVMNATIYL